DHHDCTKAQLDIGLDLVVDAIELDGNAHKHGHYAQSRASSQGRPTPSPAPAPSACDSLEDDGDHYEKLRPAPRRGDNKRAAAQLLTHLCVSEVRRECASERSIAVVVVIPVVPLVS